MNLDETPLRVIKKSLLKLKQENDDWPRFMHLKIHSFGINLQPNMLWLKVPRLKLAI